MTRLCHQVHTGMNRTEQLSEWSRIKEAQRIARERRDVLNRQRADQVRVNATPQTLRKLERPVIDRLLQRGQLGDEQHRAAEEIARVWIAITSYLFPRPVTRRGCGRVAVRAIGRLRWSSPTRNGIRLGATKPPPFR